MAYFVLVPQKQIDDIEQEYSTNAGVIAGALFGGLALGLVFAATFVFLLRFYRKRIGK